MSQDHTNDYEQLKLSNQLCFPFYAASMLITRYYQPLLDEIDLTYPQYIVLMVLWEKDEVPVSAISTELLLNTNTLTPLLKRMEGSDLIKRTRSRTDERQVLISLTEKGLKLKEQAAFIPQKMMENINYPIPKALTLMNGINDFLAALKAGSATQRRK